MKTIENQRYLADLPKGKNVTLDCNTSFVPTRCPFCNQRLFDVSSNSNAAIQIKCHRCSQTVLLSFMKRETVQDNWREQVSK